MSKNTTPPEGYDASREQMLDFKVPEQLLKVLDEAGFTSVVATNCEQEYLRELVPGDQLTHTVEVESVSPEKKTGLGVGHFVTQLYEFLDAQDEVVGTMRFRILKFRPPSLIPDT